MYTSLRTCVQWTWWTGHRFSIWPCEERICGAYSLDKSPVSKPCMLEPGSTWEIPACDGSPSPGDCLQILRKCTGVDFTPVLSCEEAGAAHQMTTACGPSTKLTTRQLCTELRIHMELDVQEPPRGIHIQDRTKLF